MTDNPAEAANAPITVHVEVLGSIHDASPPQRAVVEELPAYLAAEGVTARLHYRPAGGADLWAPIETISLFIGTNVAAGLIGSAAWASMTGAIKWARERIRREPPGPPTGVTGPDDDPFADRRPTVSVSLYGPGGELLRQIAVNRDEVNTPFGDPIEDPTTPDNRRIQPVSLADCGGHHRLDRTDGVASIERFQAVRPQLLGAQCVAISPTVFHVSSPVVAQRG